MKKTYTNAVVVQSVQRTALDGSDQRDEINTFIDQRVLEREASIKERNGPRRFERGRELRALQQSQEARRKRYQRRYVAFDDRDEKGTDWMQEEGALFRRELEALYREGARLMLIDLQGQGLLSGRVATQAPGNSEEVYELPELATEGRVVYRFETGELISINNRSRLIPPSTDD